MKINKNALIAVAAGVAAAGSLSYLFGTEKGRNTTKKWRRKGEKLVTNAEEIIGDAKIKLTNLQREAMNGCGKNEHVSSSGREVEV